MIALAVHINAKVKNDYETCISFNPLWKSEIDRIIKVIVNNPEFGGHGVPLTDSEQFLMDKINAHLLTKEERYKDNVAASLSSPDNRHWVIGTDKFNPRIVWVVRPINSFKHLYYVVNAKFKIFDDFIDQTYVKYALDNFTKNEFCYIIINEVGGHYSKTKSKSSASPEEPSAEELAESIINEAFAITDEEQEMYDLQFPPSAVDDVIDELLKEEN